MQDPGFSWVPGALGAVGPDVGMALQLLWGLWEVRGRWPLTSLLAVSGAVCMQLGSGSAWWGFQSLSPSQQGEQQLPHCLKQQSGHH